MRNTGNRIGRAFVGAVCFLALVASAGAESPAYDIVEVSPSVVMARNSRGSNLTCFALKEGLVFADTGLRTQDAARFRAEMQTRFGLPTRALFLTHAHLDHFLGMGAFADVEVIASAASRSLFERQLAIDFDEPKAIAYFKGIFPTFAEDIVDATLRSPTLWFDDELVLGSGAHRLVLGTAGGHTTGSAFAYFEAEGVIATGDLVQAHRYPYFGDPATDLRGWQASLERWHGLEPEFLCPGHGPVTGRDYLPPIVAYFEDLLAAVSRLKSEGLSVEEVIGHESLPKGYWPQDLPVPRWWPYCLARAFATPSSDEEAITALFEDRFAALWRAGDAAGLAGLWVEEGDWSSVVGSRRIVSGRKAIEGVWQVGLSGRETSEQRAIELEVDHVRLLDGHRALVDVLMRFPVAEAWGEEAMVFVVGREADGWRVISARVARRSSS